MRTLPLLLALLPFSAAVSAAAPHAGLDALYEAEWQRDLRENPFTATYVGDRRFDREVPDLSPQRIAASAAADRAVLTQLAAVDPATLDAGARLNQELFARLYAERVREFEYGTHYQPLSHMGGVQTAHELAELLPFASAADYDHWLARLAALPRLLEQTEALMREGLRRGHLPPQATMRRVPEQLATQLVSEPRKSPFFQPFERMPDTLAPAEQARLRAAAEEVIGSKVVPAYRRFDAFFRQEYLPASRASVGVWDTPGGAEWYRDRIAWYTTTSMSAEEIHALGLAEVARIRGEMQKVIERVGFKGSFEEFLAFLRSDERFRYRDPQRLFEAYLAMSKRVDPHLPRFFGKLPRMPYGVRPIPAESAPSNTTAYYQAPSLDGRRAGYYYVNLYKPEERPTYEIPVLTIHEAVPGHHLQIALAQELGGLPTFRRDFEATAFVEGWALYSESLGEEMGLYDDPYDKFGQLTYEMWRAVRLVVDTGIHHKRWTRQQAIDFFKANAPKTELDIVNEIDRYIAWPGQALAYKVGELRIKQLRAESSAALGERFDLRDFHDVVLGSGAVPLDVLERNVREWQRGVLATPVAGKGAP